jgi:tryptophan synthase alpha chain
MDILKLVKKVRKDVNIPLLLMTYYNPVFALGEDRFIRLAVACGVDGVIIPDLPFDEGKNFTLKAAKAGLHNISFVSPVTSPSRIKLISRKSRGFIYYISLTGVTGMRGSLPAGLKKNIALIKRSTKTPVCVGFGVSNAALAKEAGRACDGVIVGSAIVSRIKDNIKNPKLIRCLVDFVKAMA